MFRAIVGCDNLLSSGIGALSNAVSRKGLEKRLLWETLISSAVQWVNNALIKTRSDKLVGLFSLVLFFFSWMRDGLASIELFRELSVSDGDPGSVGGKETSASPLIFFWEVLRSPVVLPRLVKRKNGCPTAVR